MKYIVSRTSNYWGNKKPCDEAFEETVIEIDERLIDDPMKNKIIGKSWYTDAGWFNHRVENGHIKRDRYKKAWMVEINTLEELNNFIDKYDRVVIDSCLYNNSYFEIEIYDNWRE